jgi:hypothetical protein
MLEEEQKELVAQEAQLYAEKFMEAMEIEKKLHEMDHVLAEEVSRQSPVAIPTLTSDCHKLTVISDVFCKRARVLAQGC